MRQQGSVFLIVALAVIILLMLGAAFLMMTPAAAGSGGSAMAPPAPTFSVAMARTPAGMTATLTVANKGSGELRDLRLIRADIASQVGGKPLPLMIGTLNPGVSIVVTLPYAGPAPASKAPIQLQLQYDYKSGFFTHGGGSESHTTILP